MSKSSITLPGRYYRTYPIGAPLGYVEEPLELDLERTVFLVIDAYGKGYDDGGAVDLPPLYKHMAAQFRTAVREYIAPAKAAAKRLGVPIVNLTNYLSPALNDRSEWRNLSLRVHGVDVLEAWREPNDILAYSDVIAPGEGEYLIKKQLYSGFFETHLDSLLRSLDARNLVTVGFDSRICLGTTVIDAMYRNYRVIVLRDAIGTTEEPETADGGWATFTAVRAIETNAGYTATTRQWLAACDAHAGHD